MAGRPLAFDGVPLTEVAADLSRHIGVPVPNPIDLADASATAVVGGSLTRAGAPGADMETLVNLPIVTDRLAIRIAGTAASEGGYIDKPLLGRRDVNRTRIAGGRATVCRDCS